MERWQSTWENSVEYNLSESGVQPIPLRELLRDAPAIERFLDHPLAYSQGNGTPELRSLIAGMYRGATPDHILVTNGSSEANLLALWHLVEPGDEVVVMLPNYMETWGLVQIFGGQVKPLRLREDLRWQFEPDELAGLVTRKTRAIAVCNPDNPTGAVMGDAQRKAVVDAARDADAWLLSDEVYIGAEREGPRTESIWGGYEKTLITNGLSKAYGLPGLRIGWLAGPPEAIATLWGYHDYTTLTPTYLSDRLPRLRSRRNVGRKSSPAHDRSCRGIMKSSPPGLPTTARSSRTSLRPPARSVTSATRCESTHQTSRVAC